MLGIALFLSVIPAAKRIDQWTARSPVTETPYIMGDDGLLEPKVKDSGAPSIRVSTTDDYWRQYPQGAPYTLPMLHGGLGLWQVDTREMDARQSRFEDEQKKAAKAK